MSPKSFGSINKIGKIVGNASFWRSYCRNFPASPSPGYLFPNRIHFSGSFPCTAWNYGGKCVAVRWRIAESLLAHLYSGFRFDAASDERLSRAYWGSGVFSLDGLQPLVVEVFVSISFLFKLVIWFIGSVGQEMTARIELELELENWGRQRSNVPIW